MRYPAHLVCLPAGVAGLERRVGPATPPPGPAGAPPLRGRGEQPRPRPAPTLASPIRHCDLRRRVTRGAESAAGRRYRLGLGLGLPAAGLAALHRQAARPGGPWALALLLRGLPCRAPPGMRAADCRAGRPPQSRPGRAAARAARSCTASASSCRGCSASWPSAR